MTVWRLARLNAKPVMFTYHKDADLDKQVYGLLDEIESQAELRNCFTQADMRQPGTERYWERFPLGFGNRQKLVTKLSQVLAKSVDCLSARKQAAKFDTSTPKHYDSCE